MRGSFHPDQSFRKTTQNSLCKAGHSTARSFGVQHQQLLAKGQIFEDETLAGAESNENPAGEMAEGYDHGRILSERAA